MKKTALAAAVAAVVGGGAFSAAHANTAGLTGIWTGTYTFSMASPGGGPVGAPSNDTWTWNFDNGTVTIANSATFYGSVWTASGVSITDTGSSYGPSSPGAQNMTFAWSANPTIPVSSDWDVTATGNAAGDTASVTVNSTVILPTSSAFPGFQPSFTGDLTKTGSPVPVPAAVWLFGSGLVGLVGVARRRRKA